MLKQSILLANCLMLKSSSSLIMALSTLNIMVLIYMGFMPTQDILSLHQNYTSAYLSILTLWTSMLMLLASKPILFSPMKNNFNKILSILVIVLLYSFSTSNFFIFYIMFETSLIPTLFMIMVWGYQPERLQASAYLMMYTLVASLPLLLSLISLSHDTNSLNMAFKYYQPMSVYVSISLTTAFLVKIPMFWFHLWLPKAHVEAPIAGSMILASVLLKLGVYGLIQMSLMIPKIMNQLQTIIMSISLIGALKATLTCMRQQDLKSLIAYSSVSHMAILLMALMTQTSWALTSAIIIMISHGMTSSLLFSLANMNYLSSNSRNMNMTKGGLLSQPYMAWPWLTGLLINMSVPPSINLAGEMMAFFSMMFISTLSYSFIFMIMMMTASYSLLLYTSMSHGNSNPATQLWKSNNLFLAINMKHSFPLWSLIPLSYMLSL